MKPQLQGSTENFKSAPTAKATTKPDSSHLTPQQKMAELQAKVSEQLEDPLYVAIYNARCHDSGETINLESAKLFKEDLFKRNVKNSTALNL